jgi:hypothetical protein
LTRIEKKACTPRTAVLESAAVSTPSRSEPARHRRRRSPEASAADALFASLDNRVIENVGRAWLAQVAGVHMNGRDAWVQIVAADQPACHVVLHLSPRSTATQALAALQGWSNTPAARRGSVVHVMQLTHRQQPADRSGARTPPGN